ncbi:MAG: hypothetical protein M3N13_01765, partial [Candidatus Eremiobacteraeota bacterium]|nr:hypothetical protein [Candidatus Eremiobacteraeota bacterium]
LPVSAASAFGSSPFFHAINFSVGGTNLGTTQFIDAFQRGNFWNDVTANSPDYHILLAQPTVMPVLSLTVPARLGSVRTLKSGVKYSVVDTNFADAAAQSYMKATKQIQPNAFVVFLTYNTEIGGGISFHSSVGPQTYTITMFNDPGVLAPLNPTFASVANVEVSTHEIGEWLDDPFGSNVTPGFGILEVGDPLDGNHLIVHRGGLQYNLQELAFHDYFTCKAPPSTSVNGWYSFLGKFRVPDSSC